MNEEEIKKIIEMTINKSNKEYISLKKQFEELRNDYIELARSEEQLQNNWNELKKCIGEWILYHSVCEEDYKELNVLLDVESKMQELEDGNNE